MTTNTKPTETGMIALAERCEAATGPARALSDDVLFAFGWSRGIACYYRPDGTKRDTAPHPTASLDDAMTLSNWVLLHMSDIGADGLPYVVLGNPGTTPAQEAKGVGGRTLALTYCAAALRSRAAIARASTEA